MSIANLFYPNFKNIYANEFYNKNGMVQSGADTKIEELEDVNVTALQENDILIRNNLNEFINVPESPFIKNLVGQVGGSQNVLPFNYYKPTFGVAYTAMQSKFKVGDHFIIDTDANLSSLTFSGVCFVTNSYLAGGTINPTFLLKNTVLWLTCVYNTGQCYFNICSIQQSSSGALCTLNGVAISATNFVNLPEINIVSPLNNQSLVYNSTSSKWENKTPSSAIMPFCEFSYNVPGGLYNLTITTQNTYYRIAPVGTIINNNAKFASNKFDNPLPGQLRYLGSKTVHLHCAFSISSSTANNGDMFSIQVWKNGAAFTGSIYSIKYSSNNDLFCHAIHKVVDVSTNDTISLAMTNKSSSGKIITFENLNIFVMSCESDI